jgi:hypothetical protein
MACQYRDTPSCRRGPAFARVAGKAARRHSELRCQFFNFELCRVPCAPQSHAVKCRTVTAGIIGSETTAKSLRTSTTRGGARPAVRRRRCSPATRRGGLRPTSRSCRSCCGSPDSILLRRQRYLICMSLRERRTQNEPSEET